METEMAADKLRNTLEFLFSQPQVAAKISSGVGLPDLAKFQEVIDKTGKYSKVKMSSLKGSLAKMKRKYSSNSNVVEQISNFAIVCLDGSSEEVLESYINAIVQYRLWNMQRGICVDVSPILRPHTMLYTSSRDSTFHFLVQYDGDTIDLVFDGKSAWFNGVVKEEDSFQFNGQYT